MFFLRIPPGGEDFSREEGVDERMKIGRGGGGGRAGERESRLDEGCSRSRGDVENNAEEGRKSATAKSATSGGGGEEIGETAG